MTEPPSTNEWDQLVVAMGKLTLAAGYLEVAIIAIVCGILGKSEEEVGKWRSNKWWCDQLNKIARPSWTAEEPTLATCLKNIRELYDRRNRMIHAALGLVADGSVPGAPPGSVIDLRAYGLGFRSNEGNTWTIGVVAKKSSFKNLMSSRRKFTPPASALFPICNWSTRSSTRPSLSQYPNWENASRSSRLVALIADLCSLDAVLLEITHQRTNQRLRVSQPFREPPCGRSRVFTQPPT